MLESGYGQLHSGRAGLARHRTPPEDSYMSSLRSPAPWASAPVSQQSTLLLRAQDAEMRARLAESKAQQLQEELDLMRQEQAQNVQAQSPQPYREAKLTARLDVSVPVPEVPCSIAGIEEPIGWVSEAELQQDYDLVVIGGGPTGVAAAMQAASLGRRALLVDKPKVKPDAAGLDVSFGGPTGLFSKAYREAGKAIDVKSLKSMGLYDNVIWGQVKGMCLNLAAMNAAHQVKTLRSLKVGYVQGSAIIVSANKVLVNYPRENSEGQNSSIITTSNVLVATGSRPSRPPEYTFDNLQIFDADTINTLPYLPSKVVILGAGIIAIEYAKIFRKFGAKVVMLVRSGALSSLERIGLDHDIADQLLHFLRKDDVEIFEQTTVQECIKRDGRQLTIKLKTSNSKVPEMIETDVFLVAAGRVPTTSGIGLEKLGVKIAKKGGHIEVDDRYETNVKGVFAAGDVLGPPSLASTGIHQAQSSVTAMFEEGKSGKGVSYPVGVWTTPEFAYYGLTKAAGVTQGLDVEEGKAHYTSCLRGRVFSPDGLVKLVFRKDDGVIIGVHLIGADACELVHYGMDLVCQEVSIFKLVTTLFTAVTYHELFKEAALDGNSKLAFGAQWQAILEELGASSGKDDAGFDEARLRKEFDAIDTSGDGSLDAEELSAVFQNLGKPVKKGTVANLIRLADDDGNGTIEWPEFARIFEVVNRMQTQKAKKAKATETSDTSEPPEPEKTAQVGNTLSSGSPPKKETVISSNFGRQMSCD